MTAKEQAFLEQANTILQAMDEALQNVARHNRNTDLMSKIGQVGVQHTRLRTLLIRAEQDAQREAANQTHR